MLIAGLPGNTEGAACYSYCRSPSHEDNVKTHELVFGAEMITEAIDLTA